MGDCSFRVCKILVWKSEPCLMRMSKSKICDNRDGVFIIF